VSLLLQLRRKDPETFAGEVQRFASKVSLAKSWQPQLFALCLWCSSVEAAGGRVTQMRGARSVWLWLLLATVVAAAAAVEEGALLSLQQSVMMRRWK
jgi:hypothetical protein